MSFIYKKALEHINQTIQKTTFGGQPKELYEPIDYIMSLGGKRLRPMLTLLAYQMFHEKGEYKDALKPSLLVEIFHNFSLMHDDIMDNAPLRRGKPTVHVQWNPNIAILSGDVMLVEAYKLIESMPDKHTSKILARFNQTAREVCEGQQWDMNFENLSQVSMEQYIQMIKLKTAVLLGFSLELGAMLGGANAKETQSLYQFGVDVGIAFQIMDDYLDVYGDAAKFGKKVGGDIVANKKTYLSVLALELAQNETKTNLEKLLTQPTENEQEKISKVMAIYDALGIQSKAQAAMKDWYEKALGELKNIRSAGPFRKNLLVKFTDGLMEREN